jgi:hypothetical protein
MHVIKEDLELALRRYEKTLADILYVSYKMYNEKKYEFEHYYCSVNEFATATASASCPWDISFMCYVCYVGDEWFLDYDYQGVLHLHMIPNKPTQHKAPLPHEIISVEH